VIRTGEKAEKYTIEDLYNLCPASHIDRAIRSTFMRWAETVVWGIKKDSEKKFRSGTLREDATWKR